MIVRHFDTIRIDEMTETSQGFLQIPMRAARTGTQVYRDAEGNKLVEFRPPEEVFSKKTMDSFKRAPITNDHPGEFVTVDNAKELMVGMTGDTVEKIEDKFLGMVATITDREAIQDIKSGKVEVSAGYSLNLDFTPGEIDGVKFDAVQRDILANHIAIVDRGRAGPQVRLRLDSKDAVVDDLYHSDKEKQMKLKKVTVDGKEFEVPEQVATALDSIKELETKLKDAEYKASKLPIKDQDNFKKKTDELQGKLDAANEKIEKLGSVKQIDGDQIRTMVRERNKVEGVARRIMKDEAALNTALEGKDHDLKIACIKADSTDEKLDLSEKSEEYVNARFDILAESTGKSKRANDQLGKGFSETFKQEQLDEEAAAEKKRKDELTNAWQKPIHGARQKFGTDNK